MINKDVFNPSYTVNDDLVYRPKEEILYQGTFLEPRFEVVSEFADQGIKLPQRATSGSAGYDFECAEDTLIPPYDVLMADMIAANDLEGPLTLDEIAAITKTADAKVTLVPTGIKCKLPEYTYLELSARSSLPLKHWLILGNAVGIIDSDYHDNPDNEGHIYFQIINLSPFPIIIKKGERIGQGIIKPYITTINDNAIKTREGGFGSTNG